MYIVTLEYHEPYENTNTIIKVVGDTIEECKQYILENRNTDLKWSSWFEENAVTYIESNKYGITKTWQIEPITKI